MARLLTFASNFSSSTLICLFISFESLSGLTRHGSTTATPKSPDCSDRTRRCRTWTRNGDCRTNPLYMFVHCRKSCGVCTTQAAGLIYAQEKRLKAQLAHDYDPSSRPLRNLTDSIDVRLMFSLLHLVQVDEKRQSFTVQGHLKMKWQDSRLTWDPSAFAEIQAISLSAENIWHPGITVVNTAVADNQFLLRNNPTPAMVRSSGDVIWTPRVEITALCEMDMRYFPVDAQKCSVIFGPWLQDSSAVNISIWNLDDDGDDDISPVLPNQKWSVSTSLRYEEDHFNPCCSEPWPVIKVKFVLQRHAPLYSAVVIVPLVYVMVTLIACFLLPIRSILRLILASGNTLLLLFFLLHLSRITPPVSSAPPLVVQITVALIVESTMILFTCVLLYRLSSAGTEAQLSFLNADLLKTLKSYAPKRRNHYTADYNRLQETKPDLVDMFFGPYDDPHINGSGSTNGKIHNKHTADPQPEVDARNVADLKAAETTPVDYPVLFNRLALAIFCLIFMIQTITVLVL